MSYSEVALEPARRFDDDPNAPPPLRSLADAGVAPADLLKLVLKTLNATAFETPSQLADFVKLPPRAVRELLDQAQERQLVHVLGAVDLHLASELRYALTDKGRAVADDALRQNGYVGPAPVSLTAYCNQIRRQHVS
ncbi:MAG TPA: hypothetical protein VFN88_13020, partial [Caulobacteraceae bacterium]|nr:hypothetical protein [Caulobacteraceae bacterium]